LKEKFLQAALKSDFYKKKLDGLRLDHWEEIPFTTKKELREAEAYSLLGTDIANIATYHETSGTTGKPTSCWYSHADVMREAKNLIDSDVALNENDLVLNRFTFTVAVASFIFYWACQQARAGHICLAKSAVSTPSRVLDVMMRTNPSILVDIAYELERLAGAAKRLGLTIPNANLRAIWVAGEMVPPARKKWLEKLWGVPVFGLFGTTETGGLFVTCKNGHFHLDNPNVFVEVVDDEGRPLGFNERGNFVISTLREGMPVLRYANEDLVEIREGTECGCGRTEPILIHYGRKEDFMEVNGRIFTLYDLMNIVYELPDVPMAWRFHVSNQDLKFEYQTYDGTVDDPKRTEMEAILRDKLGCKVQAYHSEIIPEASLVQPSALTKFAYLIRQSRQ
jgi:phenylacetate-CoA ligase